MFRVLRKLQQFSQAIPAFGEILAHLPEAEKRKAQAQTPLGVSGFGEPFEGGAKVIEFEVKAFEPYGVFAACVLSCSVFGQHGTESCVSPARYALLSPGGTFFPGV